MTVHCTQPSTNCREEPSNLHAPRSRHFRVGRDSGKVQAKKKSETGPQGVRESAVETFHKRGGGSRVTKAIFCSRSLLTLVRRSSGIGETERGSKAGRDITRFDHTSTNTNAPGSQVFFSPSTHHYFEKPLPSSHTTTQNGLSITTGRSRKKCRWCEGREQHGKFRKQQRDGAAHTEQKTASRSPLASKKNRGG